MPKFEVIVMFTVEEDTLVAADNRVNQILETIPEHIWDEMDASVTMTEKDEG